MGAGKSSVGRAVARRLKMRFADTDEMIEMAQCATIAQIFESQGEEAFRQMEKLAIRSAASEENAVISTGGGALLLAENLQALRENSVLFYLKARPEVLAERIKNNLERPLLTGMGKTAKITRLLKHREEKYLQADFVIDANGPIESTSAIILHKLKSKAALVAVIAEEDIGALLRKINAAKKRGAEIAELRLDFMKSPTPENVKKAVSKCRKAGLKCIITCREKREGGKWKIANKMELLKKALEDGADFIDLEFSLGKIADFPKSKVIVSYHNLRKTPPLGILIRLMEKMSKAGKIVKIVCKTPNFEDQKALMRLLETAKKRQIRLIAFGVGRGSKRSRIVASLTGSRFVYGHLGFSVAEGQPSFSELKGVFDGWKG